LLIVLFIIQIHKEKVILDKFVVNLKKKKYLILIC